MFEAVKYRKARLSVLIDDLGKQPREDLITSSIFGKLPLLTPTAQLHALRFLTGADLTGEIEVMLWPRFGWPPTESDVLLKITNAGVTSYWIIEAKWGANLHPNQIANEIAAVRTRTFWPRSHTGPRLIPLPLNGRRIAGYTLLGAEAKHDLQFDKARRDYDNVCFHRRTWPEIAQGLRNMFITDPGDPFLSAWAKMFADFLAETSKGQVLGHWRKLPMPEQEPYFFGGSRLDWKAHPVPTQSYIFN
ncbi:MAG: hypothetical protein Q4G49_03760 [Paracoccus sp. (in: a-proteobacteria)]|nr:hypothetical protein [Paracoccus sp. (in: a-proteobacteria)]